MTDGADLNYRRLGTSDLLVSPVSFGCWPIAGISSLDVNDRDSLATLHAACDAGINFFDTAYSYGYDGEADRLLAQVLRERDEKLIVASKVGSHYRPDRTRCVDGRPETLIRHAQTIVRRLGLEAVDILYLHEPDPQVPIEESAGAMAEVIRRGWARYAGVSNVTQQQLAAFHEACPVVVVQPPFNMLQSDALDAIREYCLEQQIGVAGYWVLMKGLLAGKLLRDHQFDPRDRRLTYSIYQGAAWERAHDLLDNLRTIAASKGCTVSQLVIAWTLQQPAVTVAICGAKRSAQISETSLAMQVRLNPSELGQIEQQRLKVEG